jgi:ABC-type lipoprotein export system ATPase subunit
MIGTLEAQRDGTPVVHDVVAATEALRLRSVTIYPGTDKSGTPETFAPIELRPGDLVALVGPTGSGKSRLLADIEWLARGDTPSRRKVLVDGIDIERSAVRTANLQLVAQLSQTMTFVVDLTVGAFLELHCRSRGVADHEPLIHKVILEANALAGEAFSLESPLSALSGGQSRALMIADTAVVSRSPIVLIDEVENAGIDRRRALSLLTANAKIVLMATHDPLLALLARRRLVIRNGGVQASFERSQSEERLLRELEGIDARVQALRDALRHGRALG